ncbi:hypothetical protein M3Y95_00757600 [Aphelenchoides besseyi]|nr:hypothetical protein M3Y95_00757600 [Aphelenchoides besseyi]
MNDFVSANGLTPTIALLCSDSVERAAAKNNLTFADLLAPFCTVQATVSDPLGQQSNTKLQLDIRDIRRNGHLLSLTVLPSVLQETVRLCTQSPQSDDAWTSGFKQFFHYWLEPAEHDFLASYICCVFVVSADDPDPVGELNRLTQQQNYQQHSPSDPGAVSSPAHCSIAKWFLPQILKYYLLVEDVSNQNEQKAAQSFAAISSAYGQQFCYHLKINSSADSNMPDPWSRFINLRHNGLESGLEVARRELLNANNSNSHSIASELSNLSITSVSTVSSEIQRTSGILKDLPSSIPHFSSNDHQTQPIAQNQIRRGVCLDATDRDRLRSFVENFVKNVLIPYVERQLVTQNEALVNRRGIGKSFTNMKKWLNVGSVTSTAPTSSSGVNYTPESAEMQTRRLADLAFIFGLYTYSNQLYQTLKKDFLNDQAWLHHAGALEMCALSSFLASTSAQLKNYPARYMDSAIDFYINTCGQLLLAVRCTLFSVEVLCHLEKYTDAANQILRLTSRLPDLYGGVFLEHAANLFAKSKWFRRRAFHLVLAGHRYERTGLSHLAFRCYGQALPELIDKKWVNAEDNVLCVVVRDPNLNAETRTNCNQQLIRPFCLNQSEEQQAAFARNYIQNMRPTDGPCLLPLVVGDIETFYGEQPSAYEAEDLNDEIDSTVFSSESGTFITQPTWIDLERSAFRALRGASASFHSIQTFGNNTTNNSRIPETPANERYVVRVRLVNPLKVPIRLHRLRLGFSEVMASAEPAFSFVSEINTVDLPGITVPVVAEHSTTNEQKTVAGKGEEVQVVLSVIPTSNCTSFKVSSLEFLITMDGLPDSYSGSILLATKGKRLFNKKEERLNKTYAVDNRLNLRVPSQLFPFVRFTINQEPNEESTLELQSNSLNLFCSQVYQLKITANNVGPCDVERLCVAYDHPSSIIFMNDTNSVVRMGNKNGHSRVAVTQLIGSEGLKSGEQKMFRLFIQAPTQATDNMVVNLLFYYISADKILRPYRYRLSITCIDLVQSNIRVLDSTDGLCALTVRNAVASKDTFAQIECTQLNGYLTSSANPMGVQLRPLSKRNVAVDMEQTDTYCFNVNFLPNGQNEGINMSDKTTERIPLPDVSIDELADKSHLQFELLWRARITNQIGKISTIFGRSLISNPFIEHPSADPLVKQCAESANPIPLLQEIVPKSSDLTSIDHNNIHFLLTFDELYARCLEFVKHNVVEDAQIPWKPILTE